MLEIYIVVFGSAKIAEMAENKGQSGLLWRILAIAGWFFGACFSALIAVVLTGAGGKGPDLCALLLGYLLGGCLGLGAVTLAIAVWPEPPRERGYLDDYDEYQRTGRVRGYRDDQERRRPRRRPHHDDYEERPRRHYEDDDPPRRDDRYREDDRPRRGRPRPDDDY